MPDNKELLKKIEFLEKELENTKKLERQVRALSIVIEQSPAIVVVTDNNGIIEYINPTFIKTTGYTSKDVLGQNPRILQSGLVSPETYKDLWQTITAGKVWEGEFINKKKNGDLYTERAYIAPLIDDDGNITHFVANKEDITNFKMTDELLRLSKQELGLNEKILRVFLNIRDEKVYHEILNIILEEFESRFGFFGYINKDGNLIVPTLTNDIWDICKVKNKNFIFEKNDWVGIWGKSILSKTTLYANSGLNVPEGHVKLENTICAPIIHHDEVIGLIALANRENGFNDDDKILLNKLCMLIAPTLLVWIENKNYQDELEERVDEETRKNMVQEKIIFEQKKFSDISKMISAVAHQWRQPLNTLGLLVQDFAEMYRFNELTEKIVDESESQCLEVIKKMSKTLDDFRNFFTPETDAVIFNPINKILEVLDILKEKMTNRRINFTFTCKYNECETTLENSTERPNCCRKDKSRFRGYMTEFNQITLNILMNSIDAIIANKEKNEQKIAIYAELTDNEFIFIVKDTGGGIDDESMNYMFNPYYSTKDDSLGAGLGLYMSKVIIEKHFEGSIKIENIDGGAKTTAIFKI